MPHPVIFDRTLLRARRARAAKLGPATFLLERAADDLAERLSAVLRRFDLARRSRHADRCGAASARWPRRRHCCGRSDRGAVADERLAVVADEEALPFRDASLDLVVSALALQFVNDLPGALIQIRRALKPDGLLLAAMVGGESLAELREAFAAGRGRGRRRRVAARRAVRRSARPRRAAAARGLRAAGHRRGPGHGALCLAACADARPSPHGRGQRAGRAPPARRSAARRCAGCWKSMRSDSPIRTAVFARRSRSSGCRAGRRMKASSSR